MLKNELKMTSLMLETHKPSNAVQQASSDISPWAKAAQLVM